MYTVLIADDEEQLRKALIRKVKWNELGFEVVGEAENGAEAIELVEELEPDLLLTDIRMPFVNGIELARQAREIHPMMQIAFLSGFDDFSYAQQAIQYNIISYMLKPISSDELSEELTKIRRIMDEKFETFHSHTLAQEQLETSSFLIPLLLDDYYGDSSEEAKIQALDNAVATGIISEDGKENIRFCVMVTRMEDEEGDNLMLSGGAQSVDDIIHKYIKSASFYSSNKVVSLLASTESGFEKYLHIIGEEIVQSVRRILHFTCSVGISRITTDLTHCHQKYLEAVNASNYSKKAGDGVHFISDEERTQDFDQKLVERMVGEVETLIRGAKKEKISEFLSLFFEQVRNGEISKAVANFILVQIVTTVYQTVYSVGGNDAVQELQSYAPLVSFAGVDNPASSEEVYRDFIIQARQLISNQRKMTGNALCDNALSIIDTEYMDQELSLVSVSKTIAVSPNYLSALIKKSTGNTFVDLLTKKRIEVAQNMLLNSDFKIKEIAEKCGYSDQHYFSYCFKKYVGMSPNICRRANENNPE